MHFNVTTTSATNASGQTLYAKLPSYSSSLISRVEILVNGQDILSGLSQYGAASNLHNALYNTREKLHGIESALENTFISDEDKIDSKTLVIRKLLGLNSSMCSTRYWPVDLIGSITIRFTLAPPAVLLCKVAGQSYKEATGSTVPATGSL
eukprot:1927607-Pleurochrysis_carterae.AAC.1